MARPATGAVVQSKTGAYALRFTAYKERRYVTLETEAEGWTRDRAEAELQNVMADVRRGRWSPPVPAVSLESGPSEEPTFHVFASEWFAAKRPELRESTADTYLWHLRDHLLPYFKDHLLSQITIAEVDRFRQFKLVERERVAAARARGETRLRPLSNETINKLLVRLGQILDVAEERELIARNPMRVNSRNRKLKVNRPSRSYLDSARQIGALLDAAGELDRDARVDHRHMARRAMFQTFVFSGMRLGDLVALRWRDVDLADGWLYVGHAKTDAGVRRIKIRPALRDALLDLKANATAAGPDALVFATANGKPHAQSNVRRTMTNVVARANERLEEAGQAPLPRLSPHALRRTWASVMFALGESIPIVMAEGGWADPKVALTVYAHAMRRDAAENEALRALLEGSPIGSSGSGAASAPTADGVEIAS
jgi:integrase